MDVSFLVKTMYKHISYEFNLINKMYLNTFFINIISF